MSIDVTALEDERETWNGYVDRSDTGSFFHRYELLQAAARHSSATLHPLVGYKGQEPVGVFPAFEIRKGGVSTVFSPPPRLGLMFQGPATIENPQLKQRKLERQRKRFIEGCLDWLEDRVDPRYYRICTPVGHDDPRPFTWNEYETSPRYTYRLDIDQEPEAIKRSFSKSLRRYLDPDDEERFTIEEGGEEGIRFIHEQVRARYDAQDKTYTVPLDFLLDLYETLPDGSVRPYVATVDGERASGILLYEDDSTCYYSEGGGKPDVDFPINDLLHWEIIRRARERGVTTYDLYGANTPRICEYKSKFNPELQPYYEAEKGSMLMETAAKLYKRYR